MRNSPALLALSLLAACGSTAAPDQAAQVQLAGAQDERLQGVCTAPQTYARLKTLAFEQAARRRGGDVAQLDEAAAGAAGGMLGPVTAAGNPNGGVVVCSGRFLLEWTAQGAEARRLAADIEYAAQAASDGSGLVFEVEGAEPIIGALATIGGPPARPTEPVPASDPGAPGDGQHRAQHSTGPSFDCARTRRPSETMICSSAPLSALDRQMASLYYDRMARSDERTRLLLRRTRDTFLQRRDRCREAGCVASVYEDRISEIARMSPPA